MEPIYARKRVVVMKKIDTETAFGRNELMITAAVRYCLGRMSYIGGDCAEWLINLWPHISDRAKAIIQSDVEEAFAADDEARAKNEGYNPLGWDCDRRSWENVRKLWNH